jgi:hypothetical protein
VPTRNVHIRSPFDAEQTPPQVFRALSISNWEERDSDNYPEGAYFAGEGGEVELTLWRDEHAAFEDYPFHVALQTGAESPFPIDEVLDLMVAELLKAGFGAAREVEYREGTVERELYSLDRGSNLQKRRDTVPFSE